MIRDSGLPPKQIVKTLEFAVSKDLLGSKQDAGNSRYVIFPERPEYKNQVIKIAFNGFGLFANRNESYICDLLDKYGAIYGDRSVRDMFADISELSDGFGAIVMARIEGRKSTGGESKLIIDFANDWINRHNLGINIADLNSGGFITTNDGRCVCIDYGWLIPRQRH